MKNAIKVSVSLILALVFVLSLASCNTVDKEGLWENAEYRRDMEFGEGATTVKVEVSAENQMVTFTLHTDKTVLSEALLEHNLIATENTAGGLCVTYVNGILASDVANAYWALYVSGKEVMTSSISTIQVVEGTVYKLEYDKYVLEKTGVWEKAVHLKNMEFGEGATTVTVEVAAEGQKVTFTFHTDKTVLSDALLEHELIVAEEGPYGLYITHVNGIHASDDDKAYWAIYVNGEYGMNGISSTPITEGTVYKLAYETY